MTTITIILIYINKKIHVGLIVQRVTPKLIHNRLYIFIRLVFVQKTVRISCLLK